jgi:hypothetical protein
MDGIAADLADEASVYRRMAAQKAPWQGRAKAA